MLDELKRNLANLLYSVPSKIEKFQKNNPTVEVAVAGATKARKMEEGSKPRYELGWISSKRSVLILASDGLHCGDWFVPLADIQESKLLRISGGLLLKVSTINGLFYQFGLQYDPAWESQTILQLEKEDAVMTFSPASVIIRLIVIAFFVAMSVENIMNRNIDIMTLFGVFVVLWLGVPLLKNLFAR